MREKKIKSTKLDSFSCVIKYVNLVKHIYYGQKKKKILKRTTVDTIVNQKMSPVYFTKTKTYT